MLICLVLYLFYTHFLAADDEDDEIECEGLVDYWDAVRDIDKREMVLREEYNFKHYDGFKTFTDTTFEKLKRSQQADQNYIL